MTRVILIASGKGGVGKTTVSANLAVALTKLGNDVLVIDADLRTGQIGHHFGLTKKDETLIDVLEGKTSIHNVVYYHPAGIKFVPTGGSMYDVEARIDSNLGEAVLDLVGSVDIILIDAAAGIGEDIEKAASISDEILIITNPELPAIVEALKMHKFALKRGLKPLGIVINKYQGKNYELTEENIEEFTELPVVAIIPDDEKVKRAIMEQTPITISEPNAKTSMEFKKLAARVVGKEYVYIEETFFSRLKRFLKRYV
ncbi:septum site-determining protein MinD [archaeon CG10_big_fil_rev_8_21_14_0_10_43_11]|nr:MAG: septum site-determining protein MinD [archaeon CG10_big_fil_rev_8_21_14_0_10_43_11]